MRRARVVRSHVAEALLYAVGFVIAAQLPAAAGNGDFSEFYLH